MRLIIRLLACAAAVFPALVSAAISDPIRIESGLISGSTNAENGVRSFKGIPYAAPPLGDLRWRPPQPPTLWDGVRKQKTSAPFACKARAGARPARSPAKTVST